MEWYYVFYVTVADAHAADQASDQASDQTTEDHSSNPGLTTSRSRYDDRDSQIHDGLLLKISHATLEMLVSMAIGHPGTEGANGAACQCSPVSIITRTITTYSQQAVS